MTHDVVALVASQPDGATLLRAIAAADPELLVQAHDTDNVLRLFAPDRTLLASIETPTRVDVAGEGRRLLGLNTEPATPYWWVEIRCPFNRPDAVDTAMALADELVRGTSGIVWSTCRG